MNSIVNLLILLPARIAAHFSWAGPLIMRIVVGYTFMLAGWGKLTNLAQVTENFVGWGIPFPNILTPFVSGVECFGGAMLILGLFTRIPAAMLAVVMVVAIKVMVMMNPLSSKAPFLTFLPQRIRIIRN